MWCAAVQSLPFGPDGAGGPGRDRSRCAGDRCRAGGPAARGDARRPRGLPGRSCSRWSARNSPGSAGAGRGSPAVRFEPDQTITLLAGRCRAAGAPVPAGERRPVTAALRGCATPPAPSGPDGRRPAHRTIHHRDTAPRDPRGGRGTDPGRRPRMGGQRGRLRRSPEPVPAATETRMAAGSPSSWRRRSATRKAAPSWRASRARAIAAADESRRWVQRDLHDGAQQRLADTILRLQLAKAEARWRDHARRTAPRRAARRGPRAAVSHWPAGQRGGNAGPAARPRRDHCVFRGRRGADQRGQARPGHRRGRTRRRLPRSAGGPEIRDDGPGGADPRHTDRASPASPIVWRVSTAPSPSPAPGNGNDDRSPASGRVARRRGRGRPCKPARVTDSPARGPYPPRSGFRSARHPQAPGRNRPHARRARTAITARARFVASGGRIVPRQMKPGVAQRCA